MFAFLLISCSKDATDSANSNSGFSDSDINKTWKETTSGFVLRISSTSTTVYGNGYVSETGTSFPASAVGGRCMSEIERKQGGYWEGYNWSYNGSTWVKGSIIGMAMNDAKTYFKIGTKIYYKQ